jgi:hypothetical protein
MRTGAFFYVFENEMGRYVKIKLSDFLLSASVSHLRIIRKCPINCTSSNSRVNITVQVALAL